MERLTFGAAVKLLTSREPRYQSDGYYFIKDSLERTLARLRKEELEEHRQVTGPELLEGLIDHALAEFGSMAVSVLESWGISDGEDVGKMVFLLIGVGAFGRSDEDSPEDFVGVVDLRERLLRPYRPSRRVLAPASQGVAKAGAEPTARGNQPAESKEL